MADNSFITQCPHCNTSFRVRHDQLAVANGSVRCGACLQVFSARNHIQKAGSPTAPAKKTATAKQGNAGKRPAAAQKPASAMQAAPKRSKPPIPKTPKPPKEEFLFSADEDDDSEFLFMDGEDDDDFVFSDGPDDTLFEENERDDGFGELSDSFLNLSNPAKQNQEPQHFQTEAIEMESNSLEDEETPDESWAESMLEEIEKEDKISLSKPAVFEPQETQTTTTQKKSNTAQQHRTAPVNSVLSFNEQPFTAQRPSASQVVSNASKEIDLDFGDSEHLQKLRPLGWVAVVVLTVLLAAQFAWAQRDKYARMDQWRGLYQQACNVLGCTLPEQIDLSAIRTSINIRPHKDSSLKDLRIVDIVLTNQAPFKQPFPNLLLKYTDVNSKPVADQLFTPENYLKGEMTGETLMPVNTRIYISFPIKKPANHAINYQLVLVQ